VTLRRAALAAGFTMLVQTVAVPADFFIFPHLVVPHDAAQTATNVLAHRGLYVTGALLYLINFLCDVVIAWAFYFLFLPVSRPLSLLAAWFNLVYAAVVLGAWLKLLDAYRLLTAPDYLAWLGRDQLYAHARLALSEWRWEFAGSLLIFSCHLALLGYLIYRSRYVPKVIGVLILADAVAWVVDTLQPYLYPGAELGFLFPVFFAEWVLMVWLLIAGWRITERADAS
jgi:Domain of unknown function (DUF4386)